MSQPILPRTYEEWLAMTDEQREAAHRSWNAYEREGIGFPYAAAGRLAIASGAPVIYATVGTFHGGEYLLHMYVPESALADFPKPFEQTFEGFRVLWLAEERFSGPL